MAQHIAREGGREGGERKSTPNSHISFQNFAYNHSSVYSHMAKFIYMYIIIAQ